MSEFDRALDATAGPKLTVLSFGGGQDSTTIFWKLIKDPAYRRRWAPNDLIVVMAATGDEHPETNAHVERIKAAAAAHGIPFFHVTPDLGFHTATWQNLRQHYRDTKTINSKAFAKTCTDNLKVQPIYRWLEQHIGTTYGFKASRRTAGGRWSKHVALQAFAKAHGKIRVLIGIAKGEEKRVAKAQKTAEKKPRNRWMAESVDRVYPLIEEGLDRAGCQREIAALGEEVPVPSNCLLCPFMDLRELLLLARKHPADFADWCAIEHAKLENNRDQEAVEVKDKRTGKVRIVNKNFGVWGTTQTLEEKLADAEREFGHMTLAELEEHRFSHGHCVASQY